MTQIIVYDHPAGTLERVTAESYAEAAQIILDNLGISLFTEAELKEFSEELYVEYHTKFSNKDTQHAQ